MPLAERDVLELAPRIATDNPSAAAAFALRIIAAIESLDRFPRRGRVAAESRRWGMTVRVRVLSDYRILYTIRGAHVFVLRVIHGSRASLQRGDEWPAQSE